MPTLSDFQNAAKGYSGKCLIAEPAYTMERVEWLCEKRHRFSASLYNVKKGYWCPSCIKLEAKNNYLLQIQKIAESKGGKCVSKNYVNNSLKLEFRCRNGHTFHANANNIKSGWWCKFCSGSYKHNIEMYREYAKGKGGKLLSKSYVNVDTQLSWQCSEKHTWNATPYTVKTKGYWCPYCDGSRVRISKQLGLQYVNVIEDFKKLAIVNNGLCLSEKYEGCEKKLKWPCKKGHIWLAHGVKIKLGQWCRKCRYEENGIEKRVPLKFYRDLATARGGLILSTLKNYEENYPVIRLRCDKGHEWETKVCNLQVNSWCPHPECLAKRKGISWKKTMRKKKKEVKA